MDGYDHATARLHREWLRELERFTGKTLSRIADEIGVARSTLTRPLKAHDAGTSVLHPTTIAKVVSHTGFPPPGADAALATLATLPLPLLREDAAPYKAEPGQAVDAAVHALSGGRSGVDPWIMRSNALELLGFMPGDIVLIDLNATPKPGDAVCAQVYDWRRGKAETVMRVFERAAPVDLLIGRSRDPNAHAPLVVDGERVVIKGVILPHRLRANAA